MKKLVSTTAALSIALSSVNPVPLLAQEAAQETPCTSEDPTCETSQEALEAPAAAPEEPAAAPEPEAAPTPETAEEAPEATPAPEPATEPAAPAPAEVTAPEPSAATETPAPEVVEELSPEVSPPAEEAKPSEPQAEPEREVQPLPEGHSEVIVTDQEPAPEAAPAAPPEAPAVEEAPQAEPTAEERAEMEAVQKAAEEAAKQAQEQAAAAAAAPVVAVQAPEVPKEQAAQLETLIEAPEEAAPLAATTEAEASVPVVETVIAPEDVRSSAQEFAAPPVAVEGGKKSGLSDLEKAGLVALGALALGTMMSSGREVVSNSGDRVVVRDQDGGYQIYKDDDTLLRRPGATVRTQNYNDGSTRTTVERDDGVSVVTLRDASGRVLRRTQIDPSGREHVLIDDLRDYDRVDTSLLPKPRPQEQFVATGDAALAAALAREDARALGRSFSLRQIRDIPELRQLAVTIDVDNITFASGSAVIRPSEAPKLASLGRIMQSMLAQNPAEVFLVEGHTDAVGSDASNLTLSDRRAESVALALTEYYRIPPENMVVQGYGESELRINTQADEPRNRRVVLRLITPLMEARN